MIFAILKNERIEMPLPDLRWATMSAVSVAEVWTKLTAGTDGSRQAGIKLLGFLREIAPFTADQARLAGELQMQPGVKGISLGDRACLALALSSGAEVYTADKIWARLKLPCAIHLIR